MAKKITSITEQELIDAVNAEGLGVGHAFESELDMGTASRELKRKQLPGTIGVTRTANEEHVMSYIVDENRQMTKIALHNDWEEAYGRALELFRSFAKEEGAKEVEGESFHYGPISTGEAYDYDPDGKLIFKTVSKDGRTIRIHDQFSTYHIEEKYYEAQKNWKKPGFYAYEVMVNVTTGKTAQDRDELAKAMETDVLKTLSESVNKAKVTFYSSGVTVKFRTAEKVDSFDVLKRVRAYMNEDTEQKTA